MEIPQKYVIRYHAPRKEHGESEEESDSASVGKTFPRQRIGTDEGHRYIDKSTKDSIENRVSVT
jgi:hypothetical protein